MTLRTPPVKGSLLALRELLGYYNGTPLNEVLNDLYERIGVVPVTEPEPEPTGTELTDENFDGGGLDGAVPSTLNTSAASWTGSGTCTLSDGQAKTGGLGLLVDGTTVHFGTYGDDHPSHTLHYRSPYWFHERNPSDPAWLWGVRNGTDTADAFRVGVDSAGKIILDDGTGAVVATSASAFTFNVWSRLTITAGGGQLTVYGYTGGDEASTATADAFTSVTCAIAATTFSNDIHGLLEDIVGTGSATGNLQNEGFEEGTNGAVPTTSNTSHDAWTGSGACTITTAQAEDGTKSLAVSGTLAGGSHIGRKDNPSHTKHYKVVGWRLTTAPSAGSFYLYEARDGGGSTVAGQFGIQSDGKVRIRDGNSGTASVSAGAATTGVWYDSVLEFDPSQATSTNRYICRTYLRSSGVLQHTLNSVLTATNFSDDIDGFIPGSSMTGTAVYHLDSLKADNATVPYGGVAAVGIKGRMDRDKSDSATMPPPLAADVDPPPPPVEGGWVPTSGIYIGATTGTVGTQGGSTASGMTTYTGITGGIRPHIVGFYKSGTSWNGIPTSAERTLIRPTTGMPAIPHWRWKPNNALTWAQIAAGGADTAIRAAARGLAQYGHIQLLSFFHEPEDNVGPAGYSAADFKAFFRHCVLTMRNEWATTGVLNPRVFFIPNFMAYSSHASIGFDDMYPGDDVCDGIGMDPYFESGRNGLGATTGLLNENIAGDWTAEGYEGFYDWATTPHTNFAGNKPIIVAEWGTDFNDFTDSQAATRIDQVTDGIEDWPAVKAMEYWASTVSTGIDAQLSGHPLASAAYRRLAELPYGQQTIT